MRPYSPFRHLPSAFYKSRPVHLTLFLTRRCNAGCSFCFYSGGQGEKPARPKELTAEEIGRISSSMGNLLWIAFSGGEIFLRKDLAEIARIFYRGNRPALMLLPTNGLLPETILKQTETILTECPRTTVTVKLSLDGDEGTHDSLRGVKGAYRRVVETYEALKPLLRRHRNFELGVNTVMCAENQDQMAEVRALVKEMEGIKTHTVSLVRGSVPDASQKEVDPAKYFETLESLESDARRRADARYSFRGSRLKVAQDILQRRLIHRTMTEKREIIPCYAGKLNLVVTEDGTLYPCESFSMPIGNLRDCDFDMNALLSGERGRQVVAAIEKGCWCTHECYTMTNILFNPRMYPALLREYLLL